MTENKIATPLDAKTGRPNRKVRIVLAWGHYRVGDVIEPAGTFRSELVRNGYAVTVPAETPLGAAASAKPKAKRSYVNRMMKAAE